MQIHLNLHSRGLQWETLLRPKALPEPMELDQRHRVKAPKPGLVRSRKSALRRPLRRSRRAMGRDGAADLGPPSWYFHQGPLL